ncbi:hypothetical protein GGR56DRAFT_662946 [Xylariaceae sp. FL0804]|nr:hypothetical protein GGR56DRAFT_662946 [Xylariaceae sp. FL0804]
MSFGVAVQSAVFYLVSCSPCIQARHHSQSKKKAKAESQEKARLQAKFPDSYQHPDPFNTNPFWNEEIMMGPHIEAKKYTGGSKNVSQRGLDRAGKETAHTPASTPGIEPPSAAESAAESTAGSAPGSVIGSLTGTNGPAAETSPTVLTEDGKLSFSTTQSTTLSDDWNRKRYQREDEELWGHELYRTGHKLMDAIKQAGTSAGRLLEARLGMEAKPITDEDRHNFYFAPRNPPVNDYHPPIVRQPSSHRDSHKWMLQPPPPAKVMEGKVPVNRSASFASHLSRRTTTNSDGPGLGRLVHEKTVEAKLRSGEVPSELESSLSLSRPVPKRRTTGSSLGASRASHRRISRSRSLSLESSDASDEIIGKRRRPRAARPPPPVTPEMPLDSSSEDEYFHLRSTDSFGRGRGAAVRPRLHPILSSQATSERTANALPPSSASVVESAEDAEGLDTSASSTTAAPTPAAAPSAPALLAPTIPA